MLDKEFHDLYSSNVIWAVVSRKILVVLDLQVLLSESLQLNSHLILHEYVKVLQMDTKKLICITDRNVNQTTLMFRSSV